MIDCDFDRPVVIEITERCSTRGMFFQEGRTCALGDIAELSVLEVLVQNGPISVVNIGMQAFNFGKHVAVYQAQILPSVQVEVEEARAPAYVACVVAKAGFEGHIVEAPITAIAV